MLKLRASDIGYIIGKARAKRGIVKLLLKWQAFKVGIRSPTYEGYTCITIRMRDSKALSL